MIFEPTEIPDVVRIVPQVFGDERGFFMECWHGGRLADAGIAVQFVQENMSRSEAGVLRGLHYQVHNAQGKLVRALRGRIFDVAVDIRRSSPTFGRWVGAWLTEENKHALWVPAGFAHGFFVAEAADVLYACTALYSPPDERSIRWNDPAIGIQWPLAEGQLPKVSKKDAEGALLSAAELYA